ncbi:hypothetical protein GQ43DRAFT_440652 [Delitschia confertaspora ATCC 74209]|uniref:N-alpha-acetyltransferase 40 n=1 Tax=Delitschia confertaspora ATCC 74209 TaxID=1513339 RepID=A0A9P4JN87_9PLEO|nr:hypothetical protein GQ43DRAFT_440652 [Delitschia confertaspora ATCC 74209]
MGPKKRKATADPPAPPPTKKQTLESTTTTLTAPTLPSPIQFARDLEPEPGSEISFEAPLSASLNALPISTFRAKYLPPSDPLLHPILPRLQTAINLAFKNTEELTEDEFEACLELIKETSLDAYLKSPWGWDDDDKRWQMRQKGMWFLLVFERDRCLEDGGYNGGNGIRDGDEADEGSGNGDEVGNDNGTDAPNSTTTNLPASRVIPTTQSAPRTLKRPSAFLSLRPDTDDPPSPLPVLYIYEIHLHASLRNSGLGSHLLHIADVVAARVGMPKVMLTVFNSNKAGRRLYERKGFMEDVCSPENKIIKVIRGRTIETEVDGGYIILSKSPDGIREDGVNSCEKEH